MTDAMSVYTTSLRARRQHLAMGGVRGDRQHLAMGRVKDGRCDQDVKLWADIEVSLLCS